MAAVERRERGTQPGAIRQSNQTGETRAAENRERRNVEDNLAIIGTYVFNPLPAQPNFPQTTVVKSYTLLRMAAMF